MVERVETGNGIILVVRLFKPLAIYDLKLALKVHKSWWLKLRNVFALFLVLEVVS